MTNKGLLSNIYKQFVHFNIKKQTTQFKNRQKNQTDTFPKRKCRGPTGNKKMLNITNNQGNANQKHNEISPFICQDGITKMNTNNKFWHRCGVKGTLVHSWWECKLVQPLWKTV